MRKHTKLSTHVKPDVYLNKGTMSVADLWGGDAACPWSPEVKALWRNNALQTFNTATIGRAWRSARRRTNTILNLSLHLFSLNMFYFEKNDVLLTFEHWCPMDTDLSGSCTKKGRCQSDKCTAVHGFKSCRRFCCVLFVRSRGPQILTHAYGLTGSVNWGAGKPEMWLWLGRCKQV